jgi:glycine cleavage system P protein (glycine dehydrogenase) subunit 2
MSDGERRNMGSRLSFERGRPGRTAVTLPDCEVPLSPLPSPSLIRDDLPLPEMSQPEIVRYFSNLACLNYSVDTGFYPLGSCTMKYNPKLHEDLARLPGFGQVHPLQPVETVQGALALMYQLQDFLAEITGMDAVSLAPAAGAHGELTSILAVRAYLESRGESRHKVLVPDSAHGTNLASVSTAGYRCLPIASDANGNTDIVALASSLDDDVAALMLTLPNTLGLFDQNILQVSEMVHAKSAQLYCDGANLNALLGRVKIGDLGFDVVHMNLHKTFSTPHGGGGPGAGPVAVKAHLAPFLPSPRVTCDAGDQCDTRGRYALEAPGRSIGKVSAFHGNFGVLVRAYAYIRSLGAPGLRDVSESAVINANYLLACLRDAYHLPYDRRCLHEVVFSGAGQRAQGVHTIDVAKRLIDYGFHPPTVYFPLIVDEALMIEPTETESKETLDAFCEAMLAIAREAESSPDLLRSAPHDAPLRRLDEAAAARHPVLRWQKEPE